MAAGPAFADELIGRVIVAACVILGGAIAFTLTTHIALPGLDGIATPTLNGSQPEIALPTEPGTIHASDTQNTDAPNPTAKQRRAKSASRPSLRSMAATVAARHAKSPTTVARLASAGATPSAHPTAQPRNSHAASPSTAGRKGPPTGHKTPPGQTKKPVH